MAERTLLLADGLYFGEAPRWHAGRLWFSDFHAHAVKSVSLTGDLRTEFGVADRPAGLGWMPDGSMLIVSMVNRQLLRRSPNGDIHVHADLSGVATSHCNDMVVDSAGRAYVGNFGFDLYAAVDERGLERVLAEHPTADLVCVAPDGAISVAANDLHFPNGSVITADGGTLIVAETLTGELTAFDVGGDGVLSNRRVWATTWPRVPDGIAIDADGAIWFANPLATECVRIAPGGQILDVIETEQTCFACALGGEDGRSLFLLTAPTFDERVAAAAPKGRLLVSRVEIPSTQ